MRRYCHTVGAEERTDRCEVEGLVVATSTAAEEWEDIGDLLLCCAVALVVEKTGVEDPSFSAEGRRSSA